MSPSAELRAWRDRFRAEEIGPRYAGWVHFGFTTVGALAAIAVAVSQLGPMRPLEWGLAPLYFVVANVGEYVGHRGPMHHRRRGLDLLFQRHTLQHHRFFTHEAMACESARDFKIMLFPPVMLVFFLGGLMLPIGALLYVAVSANAGWLFVIVGVGYFLLYEWLHFAYHLPADGWLGRRWLVARLRAHHTRHHDPRRMRHTNFNITFPIADWLFGTLER